MDIGRIHLPLIRKNSLYITEFKNKTDIICKFKTFCTKNEHYVGVGL